MNARQERPQSNIAALQPRLLSWHADAPAQANRSPSPEAPLLLARIGRLFSLTQRTLLKGRHPRRRQPDPQRRHVAGLVLSTTMGRTTATVTLAEVLPGTPRSSLHIVQHLQQELPGPHAVSALAQHLGGLWNCQRVLITADHLSTPLLSEGATVAVLDATSAAALAPSLLAAIDLGRVQLYARDDSAEEAAFWSQVVRATAGYRPDGPLAFAPTALGEQAYVLGLALAVEAANRLPALYALPAAERVSA